MKMKPIQPRRLSLCLLLVLLPAFLFVGCAEKEEPELFTEDKIAAYKEMMLEGVRQEIAWGKYVIGNNIAGLTSEMVEDYIRYLGNLRWTSLGFAPLYPGYTEEPADMAWVSSYANANMVKTDFFEARSTAYAKSTALVDDL